MKKNTVTGIAVAKPTPALVLRRTREQPDDPVLYVRPIEAARMMRISRTKIYHLINRGEIPVVRIGSGNGRSLGCVRIPMAAIRQYGIDAMAQAAEPKRD